MKPFVLYQNILHILNDLTDPTLANAIGHTYMLLGAVFAIIHQHHQQFIFQTQFWRFTSCRMFTFLFLVDLYCVQHLQKNFALNPSKPLKSFIRKILYLVPKHAQRSIPKGFYSPPLFDIKMCTSAFLDYFPKKSIVIFLI